jgi:Uncharacterized protein involved in outer membrane biogenesis
MKWIVRGLLVVVALLVLLIGGAAAFLATFNFDDYKSQITQLAKDNLNRDLQLGAVQLSYFPIFGLSVENVKLSNPPGFSDPNFLSVGTAQIGVKVLPLLENRIELSTLKLNAPQITIIQKADGTNNLAFPMGDNGAAGSSAPSEGFQMDLSINEINIADAKMRYVNEATGQEILIEPMNLNIPSFRPGEQADITYDLALKMDGQADVK